MSTRLIDMARWQARQWAMAVTALLFATLTPLAWIQWQQFRMLDDVSTHQVDSIMWAAYQLEREMGRLQTHLQEASSPAPAIDEWELLERYEVFLSRIKLISEIPRRDLLESTPVHGEAMGLINSFVAQADPLFARPAELIGQHDQINALVFSINQALPVLGELTREANRAMARFVDERNRQLHNQGVLVISLAAIQGVVLLVFVGLLVRHVRKQQRQYSKLQKLSRELAEARDQAEAANHGKSVFLANMSHEIRTPFQGLLGMLNLLDEPNLSGRQRDYLQTAQDSAIHLLGVLNDILDVSTMESGTLKLSPGPVNLRGLAQEVDGLMQVSAADKGLVLNVYAAGDLPEWVIADATRVRQILFNLISNAIKFTNQGSIIAELARAPSGQSGVVLTVRDTGVGMDKVTLQRLFTRFYQADSSLRRRIGGTGLGLEISRNLARMMGGDIQVSSEPGVGSVFTVTLDLPQTEPPALEAIGDIDPQHARRLKVLVAEDHPINLKYMNILLEKMGHDAVFCENGQEALALLEKQPFDVVLLDYHMPVLDGLATTEAIRALDGPAAGIKIILVTADVVNDTRKRAIEVGVNEFTSKPLQAADLHRALLRCGLLEDPGMPDAALLVRPSSPFPLSAYEAPVRMVESPSLSSLIDLESYSEIVSMMPSETMDEMLATLFDPPDGTLPVLQSALAEEDRQAIGYNAHKLKGTAMLLGFRAIVRTSAQIEQLATQTADPIPPLWSERLQKDVEATREALRQYELTLTA
ncbi:MAG TPA: ATP-binding protein [Hydrogenophaga sp.]|uniref:ATP-binding protein n=1 Tax=Hydrogenophaga sp. TaxID=1904254 RepID=UPI002BC78EDA|nr:ATP-binding protein [Hydrogenophaga sp.]HMN92447.1 ATP-binding protein [Hydrogenophaga sp.]HMP11044.1 ATP-binding protein [Hydrogenophaga sp.]